MRLEFVPETTYFYPKYCSEHVTYICRNLSAQTTTVEFFNGLNSSIEMNFSGNAFHLGYSNGHGVMLLVISRFLQ